jgi:hypothetical protein
MPSIVWGGLHLNPFSLFFDFCQSLAYCGMRLVQAHRCVHVYDAPSHSTHYSPIFPCLHTALFTPFTHFSLSLHGSLHSAIAQLQAHRHAWAVRRWMEYHSSVCCGRSHPCLVPNRWLGSVCPQGWTRCLVSLVCSRWFVLPLALGHHIYFCSNLMHVH